MTLFVFLLSLHILFGSICLLTGLVAMIARKKRGNHTKWGEVYHASYVGVAITAVILALMRWDQIAYLFYVAIFSYALAFYGYIAKKKKWKDWLQHHIRGMCGSYIGAVTALLVNVGPRTFLHSLYPSILNWFLPTLIGSPLIYMVGQKYAKRKKKAAA